MTVTTAKWKLDDYHRMIEVGLISGRQVELLNGEIVDENYSDEVTLLDGEISPIAFPEIKVLVRQLLS
jgi:hypothetical protein